MRGGVLPVEPRLTSSYKESTGAQSLGTRASAWVRRAGYVTAVFARFGFASALHGLGLDRFLRRVQEDTTPDTADLELPVWWGTRYSKRVVRYVNSFRRRIYGPGAAVFNNSLGASVVIGRPILVSAAPKTG